MNSPRSYSASPAPRAAAVAPEPRRAGPAPEGRLAVRLLALIVLAISLANLLSAGLTAIGLPLTSGLSLIVHSALTVGVLFAGLYLFSIGPLILQIFGLERNRDELLAAKEELARQVAERNSELSAVQAHLAELRARLEAETDGRRRAEAGADRLTRELEHRVAERTAQLEAAQREVQIQSDDLKKALDLSRESEKRYRRLVEIARVGVWTVSAEGKTNFINRFGAELLGFTIPEMLGRSPADFLVTDDLPAEIRGLDLQRRSALGPLDARMRRKDGVELWMRSTVSPVVSDQGDYLGVLILFFDGTPTRSAERRAQELAALLDLTQDGFVLCDSNLHILSWNQGAARLYGWSRDEVLGRDVFDLLADKASAPARQELLTALQQNRLWRGDLHQFSKDRRPLVVDARFNMTTAEVGKPSSIVLVVTDNTQKRRRDIQLLREQRLESAVTLANGLAQELNNSLSTVLLSAQMLRAKPLENEDQELVASIEAGAQRSAELLTQTLVFARGIEGDRVLVQPARLLKETIEIARETFPRSIQVLPEFPADLWAVRGDPVQLHQVLLKLSVRARDAMPAGGTLRLKARNVPSEEMARSNPEKAGPSIAIEIQDTGASIPAAVQDRIFEPFFNPKDPAKGAGLGLAVVLGIVKSHGGLIELKSSPGGGSTFEILLPAIADASLPACRADAERPAGQGELVLIVEEEAALREVTRRTLRHYGYEALTASDVREALSLLERHQGRVRLLLTNLWTATLDGPALASSARQIDPRIRIIASSGLGRTPGQAEKLSALQSLGIGRILSKPYSAEELLRAVRDELGAAPRRIA